MADHRSIQSFSMDSSSVPECSICLDSVDGNGRSTAKLVCGHVFHLDCIGSEFNVKKVMQCPNCRVIEAGDWLYAAGGFHQSLNSYEDFEVEEDLYPYDEMSPSEPEDRWCNYRGYGAALARLDDMVPPRPLRNHAASDNCLIEHCPYNVMQYPRNDQTTMASAVSPINTTHISADIHLQQYFRVPSNNNNNQTMAQFGHVGRNTATAAANQTAETFRVLSSTTLSPSPRIPTRLITLEPVVLNGSNARVHHQPPSTTVNLPPPALRARMLTRMTASLNNPGGTSIVGSSSQLLSLFPYEPCLIPGPMSTMPDFRMGYGLNRVAPGNAPSDRAHGTMQQQGHAPQALPSQDDASGNYMYKFL